jgi:hypothetical protein
VVAVSLDKDGGIAGPPKTDPPITVGFAAEPFTYGDDPVFDDYWDSCFDGDWTDCDELYLQSPVGSDYEWFGATCGDIVEASDLFCEEQFTLDFGVVITTPFVTD